MTDLIDRSKIKAEDLKKMTLEGRQAVINTETLLAIEVCCKAAEKGRYQCFYKLTDDFIFGELKDALRLRGLKVEDDRSKPRGLHIKWGG